jgi:hypothetical protein
MANAKNVGREERIVRAILGAILVASGFFLAGLWKPLSIGVGCFLLVTAFVQY